MKMRARRRALIDRERSQIRWPTRRLTRRAWIIAKTAGMSREWKRTTRLADTALSELEAILAKLERNRLPMADD